MSTQNTLITLQNVIKVRAELKENGVSFIENVYGSSACERIRKFIDDYNDGVEINYGGTEKRIWHAEKLDEAINRFFYESGAFLSMIFHKDIEPTNVLAYSNFALNKEDKVNIQGRWHIDSFRTMYKVFIFLTDTTENSGPFEYLSGTHRAQFRYRMAFKNNFYFDFGNPFKRDGSRPYQSISDEKIARLESKGFNPTPAIVKEGAVMIVNTTAIHRARPCLEGNRYALTAYFANL